MAERVCVRCGTVLTRPGQVRYCGIPCAARAREIPGARCDRCGQRIRAERAHRCPTPTILRKRTPGFPYADSRTEAEAPARCDRCGGIWRRVDEGLACRTCPRRWRIVAALETMRRSGAPYGRASC